MSHASMKPFLQVLIRINNIRAWPINLDQYRLVNKSKHISFLEVKFWIIGRNLLQGFPIEVYNGKRVKTLE